MIGKMADRECYRWMLAGMLGIIAFGSAAQVQAQAAAAKVQIQCTITENGAPASGTATVFKSSQEVATGRCGTPLSVSPGTYRVVFRLDGALDRPEQSRTVTATGASTNVTVNFATAVLEVRMEAAGERVAGLAVISRSGQQIGSVGSGVAAHLSAGTYDIVVRYRTQEKKFTAVTLAAGQRRALTASF